MLVLVIHQQDYHFYLLQKYLPPLAQACSLCPIHNSSFSPCPTCPICPTRPTSPIIARVAHTPRWRKLVACAQFTILSPSYLSHSSHSSYKSHNRPCGSYPPLAQACSLCPIQNSKFKIPTRIIGLKNSFLYGG